jgi:hypothetical protein
MVKCYTLATAVFGRIHKSGGYKTEKGRLKVSLPIEYYKMFNVSYFCVKITIRFQSLVL